MAKSKKIKSPFSDLGKDEDKKSKRLMKKPGTAKRVDGKGLLKLAMGKK